MSGPNVHIYADVVRALVESYRSDGRGSHLNKRFMPSRSEIIETVQLLFEVFFPGYFGRNELSDAHLETHVNRLVGDIAEKLERQVECCLCFQGEAEDGSCEVERWRRRSREICATFLARLPALRAMLLSDVEAALEGDPAAASVDEVILAYPGIVAIVVHRVAHELHTMGVPLMPRIMSEWAHTQSGADIHPGATIGERFFLDHATGCVIGETTQIGAGAKLYQGVTLGALSLPRDERGRLLRGQKRHPTVEDNVTLYAHATVLGGETVVGKGAVVGGSVFLTKSVPEEHKVAAEAPRLRMASQRKLPVAVEAAIPDGWDFGI